MNRVARLLRKLDPWLYRYPFEGDSARRYARLERSGFGDLDQRLVAQWHPELQQAERFLDLGCGPATLSTLIATRYPHLQVIGAEPSREYTREQRQDVCMVRARAEGLPLASASIDVAACISSIRHVRDRQAALRELRRVVRPGGTAYIVELDPVAEPARARQHAAGLGSRLLGLAFAPLVLATAPLGETIMEMALDAGWRTVERGDDPEQPIYILRLR